MVVDARSVQLDPEKLLVVEQLFRSQVQERWHPGAALAVYRHGQLVLDLVAGLADAQRGAPVQADTQFVLLSAGKPFGSVAVLQQIERRRAELDDPVAKYWPAFGQNGKDRVSLRHILTHRGGFPITPPAVAFEHWRDRDMVVRALEAMPVSQPPGSGSAYHHFTQQAVCAELVHRLDGRAFPDYLRAEITGPLGLTDTYVALPAELEPRVAKLHATEGLDEFGSVVVQNFNLPAVHAAPWPTCAVASARDMARFYAALVAGGSLDGVRILQAGTVAQATQIAVDGEYDTTNGGPARRGLGFDLGGLAGFLRSAGSVSSTATFGHGGAGTVICWGDTELDVAIAYIVNGFRGDEFGIRCRQAISDAVRAACR